MYSTKRVRSYKEKKEVAGKRARWIVMILFLFLVYLLFSLYVSTPLKIESRSMEPVLQPSDRILFSRISLDAQTMFDQFSFWGLQRGDLVVIRPPFYRNNQKLINFFNPVIRFFSFQKIQFSSYSRLDWEIPYSVKRIVCLPGDTVRIENFRVYITPAGENREIPESDLIKTPYKIMTPTLPAGWKKGDPFDGNMEEITLGDDEFFLLSDSRGKGSDSLSWGPLHEKDILGKVFFLYYPFRRMAPL